MCSCLQCGNPLRCTTGTARCTPGIARNAAVTSSLYRLIARNEFTTRDYVTYL